MTGCIIGSVACGFIVGVVIVALIGSASLRSREDEMREYYLAELKRACDNAVKQTKEEMQMREQYLAELEKMNEREKDNDLLGRDSNGDPAAPEAMRVRMGQQLPEGPSGCTTDCPEGRGD